MNKGLAVILLISSLATIHSHNFIQERHGPLNGGTLANPLEFPYAAALRNKNYEICTGTILNEKYVIAEAWCIDKVADVTIIVGCHDLYMSNCEEYQVEEVIYHPNYTDAGINDVGLLKVAGIIEMTDSVQAISVWRKFVLQNYTAIALGWDPWSDALRWNDVQVYTAEECNSFWGWGEPNKVICTQPGDMILEGDFGVSLVLDGHLIGVPVESGGKYDVYQRLSEYYDWIESVISK